MMSQNIKELEAWILYLDAWLAAGRIHPVAWFAFLKSLQIIAFEALAIGSCEEVMLSEPWMKPA